MEILRRGGRYGKGERVLLWGEFCGLGRRGDNGFVVFGWFLNEIE
jgi:hypothetical protein